MPSHATLASTFGFTAAESAIAASLASGTSRQEIARERGVTVETLRGQLKTLYAKTGCGREAELVALLARMSE
jgi:DNA-binding CsgD family transcriptional regulator